MNNGIGKVRGKFRVDSITRKRGSCPNSETRTWEPCELHVIRMSPVMGGNPEDNSYSEATPAGAIEMSVTRQDAIGFFDLDKTYYVDFTVATE